MSVPTRPNFATYLTTGKHSDITIKLTDGSELRAHKLILCTKSGWFRNAIEASSAGHDTPQVDSDLLIVASPSSATLMNCSSPGGAMCSSPLPHLQEQCMESIELKDDDPKAVYMMFKCLYREDHSEDYLCISEEDDPDGGVVEETLMLLSIYELCNKYDIPSMAEVASKHIFDLFESCLEDEIDVLKALYLTVSHDRHGLRRRFVQHLACAGGPPCQEVRKFAKFNLDFSGDLLSEIWTAQDDNERHQDLRCNGCGYHFTSFLTPIPSMNKRMRPADFTEHCGSGKCHIASRVRHPKSSDKVTKTPSKRAKAN